MSKTEELKALFRNLPPSPLYEGVEAAVSISIRSAGGKRLTASLTDEHRVAELISLASQLFPDEMRHIRDSATESAKLRKLRADADKVQRELDAEAARLDAAQLELAEKRAALKRSQTEL